MKEKLPAYFILYLFSFCVFTLLFNTVAIAKSPNNNKPVLPQKFVDNNEIFPTPTIFTFPSPTPIAQHQPNPVYYLVTSSITPTPLPPRSFSAPENLDVLFNKYGEEYNVNSYLLKKIAQCESGFNSQADTGRYTGMFQFASPTWISVRTAMNQDPNPDLRKNAEEAIRTAAYMLSQGHKSAWPVCSK